MYLLIDDVRNINVDVIARNSTAAEHLLAMGGWTCVIFDHDLGENDISGYDVLSKALENNWLDEVEEVQLITSNPVGRERMRQALEREGGFHTSNGLIFRK